MNSLRILNTFNEEKCLNIREDFSMEYSSPFASKELSKLLLLPVINDAGLTKLLIKILLLQMSIK